MPVILPGYFALLLIFRNAHCCFLTFHIFPLLATDRNTSQLESLILNSCCMKHGLRRQFFIVSFVARLHPFLVLYIQNSGVGLSVSEIEVEDFPYEYP